MKKEQIIVDNDIILKPVENNHIKTLFKLYRENKVQLLHNRAESNHSTLSRFRDSLLGKTARQEGVYYTIFYKGEIIGSTSIRVCEGDLKDCYSSHIWIDKNYQRKGIAQKILKARMAYIFEILKGDYYFVAVMSHNIACQRNLEKAGVEAAYKDDDGDGEYVAYYISKWKWQKMQEGLETVA